MTIRVLDDAVVNRIAAGEVVERPASVVKELLENALDAHPGAVRVELESGGKRLIRVADDGVGMARADALLCIERHATSKISSDADLQHITTLGFRGEALPSIAAVSRFSLATRRPEDDEGTRLVMEGGKLLAVEAWGGAAGTEVTVRDLFHAVPARRAFLRATNTEYGHCLEAVQRVALIQPDLDFTVLHDGREVLRAPVASSLARRVATLLGPSGEALKPVAFTRGDLSVDGLVSPVGVHRQGASAGIYLYVNGRYVRDAVIRRAVAEAYAGLVPVGRHPVVVLRVGLPPEQVDVNVHPSKVELRFRAPGDVQGRITQGLREALREHGLYTQPRPAPQVPRPTPAPPPARQGVLPLRHAPLGGLSPTPAPRRPPMPDPLPPLPALPPQPPMAASPRPAVPPPVPSPAPPPTPPAPTPTPPDALLPIPHFADLQVIGQLAESYILCEGAGELVIIDQHAAAERITLERLERARQGAGRPPAQVLLAPIVVTLEPARAAALLPHLELLRSVGLEIDPDGERAFAVRAVPPALGGPDIARLVQDLADDLSDDGAGAPLKALVGRVLATMACHTSVRARQRLALFEMRALLKDLDRVDFSVCAHGRPVAIRLTPTELEARFHRT
ncbi:MAG: DNA mismatch repair endonuclease MutL [Pseudomonadota bacterium]